MARSRLGKAERGIVKAWHTKRRAEKAAIILANLQSPKPSKERFSTIRNMLVMSRPYSGAYDATYSTETGFRGYKRDGKGNLVPRPLVQK